MKYKITIEQIDPMEEDQKYSRCEDIYVQVVDSINLVEIINAVNSDVTSAEASWGSPNERAGKGS